MTEDLVTEETAPRKRRKRLPIIVLSSALVLMLVGVTLAALYLNALGGAYESSVNVLAEDETFPQEDERPERPTRTEDIDGEETSVEDGQLNILLLGSDAGGGSGESENVPWLPNAGRADTMMWVHIPHERDSIQVMSIMRDTWVPIAGGREAKINASLSFGGAATAVATVESLFDVRIDHVAAIDMQGFQGLVTAMDGVTVDSPVAFTSQDGYQYTQGSQHLNTEQAMSFVRERYAFSGGDYQRVANQQAFVRGVLNEVLTPSTLSNPVALHNMVSNFSPYISVDSDLQDAGYIADLGWSLRDVRGGDIQMFTLPNNGVGQAGSESIVVPDWEAFDEAGEAMREGTFSEYASQH